MINEYQRHTRSNRPHASNSDRFNKQPSHRSVNFNENDKNSDRNDADEYKSVNSIYKSSQDNYDMNKDKLDSASIYHHMPAQSQREQIQVQILPQDDNWGENQTEFSFNDDMTEDGRSGHFNARNHGSLPYSKENEIDLENQKYLNKTNHQGCFRRISFYLSNYFGFICSFIISTISFLTPILFLALPRLNIYQDWQVGECGLECEGLLIGIAFKLSILLLGYWAVFRRPQSALPRIFELHTLLLLLLFIMTFSFWLFYGVRIIETKAQDYHKILQFTVSYVDVLLFVFVVTIFILEIRHLKPQFVVKIVRSPDGQQEEYSIGSMNIQRAALWLLEQYYKDFCVYNPWLENAHKKRGAQLLRLEHAASSNNISSSKRRNRNPNLSAASSVNNFNNMDNLDGKTNDEDNNFSRSNISTKKKINTSRTNGAGSIVGGNYNANDRFYEEYEYERRLRKRRARLLTSTEEAFTHIKRIQCDNGSIYNGNGIPTTLMDPYEAAQAIFTSIARDLRRYLRVTRQQPYFTRDSIVAHLANCVSYDMSPRSFLQRYLSAEPLVFNERALFNSSSIQHQKMTNGVGSHGVNYHLNIKTLDQNWILISESALYQNIEDNLMIVLKQNEVSLMCTFKRLPRFSLIEDILDPKRNKFILKLNSETTV